MSFPDQTFSERDPFALRVPVVHQGVVREIGLVPDLVFGLALSDRSRPASPVVTTRGALHDGVGAGDRKDIKELNEDNRTGELQENRGRTQTTGQAPTREQNRVPDDKKSDRERLAPATRPK